MHRINTPLIGLPNPDKGIPVLPLRPPVRSGVSEGDRFLTPGSSSIGVSMHKERISPVIGLSNPNKGVPVLSPRPPTRSSVSEVNSNMATVDSGAATTPSDRSPNQAREKIVPPPATSDQ